jgi:hypothetical protein
MSLNDVFPHVLEGLVIEAKVRGLPFELFKGRDASQVTVELCRERTPAQLFAAFDADILQKPGVLLQPVLLVVAGKTILQ